MRNRTNTTRPTGVGRVTVAAAAAGITGLALTIGVASAMVLGSAAAQVERTTLEPGYLDYGQRHRNDALVEQSSRDRDHLSDYGIRCVATGWCNMPPGVPQPDGSATD